MTGPTPLQPHVFYKTGDADVPEQVTDRNGEVVLQLCRVCGQTEVEIEPSCPGPKRPLTGQEAYEEDLRRCPTYHTGEARPTWHELHPAFQANWNRNPEPRTRWPYQPTNPSTNPNKD